MIPGGGILSLRCNKRQHILSPAFSIFRVSKKVFLPHILFWYRINVLTNIKPSVSVIKLSRKRQSCSWSFSHDTHWNLWQSPVMEGTSLPLLWSKNWMKIKNQSSGLIIKISSNRIIWGMSIAIKCQNSHWVLLMMNYATDFTQVHGQKNNSCWVVRVHRLFRLSSQNLGYLRKTQEKNIACVFSLEAINLVSQSVQINFFIRMWAIAFKMQHMQKLLLKREMCFKHQRKLKI